MASALIFAAGLITAASIILGAQYLRRLWREHQVEVERDREWDARHGITRRDDG